MKRKKGTCEGIRDPTPSPLLVIKNLCFKLPPPLCHEKSLFSLAQGPPHNITKKPTLIVKRPIEAESFRLKTALESVKKLDGVGLVDNRPSTD